MTRATSAQSRIPLSADLGRSGAVDGRSHFGSHCANEQRVDNLSLIGAKRSNKLIRIILVFQSHRCSQFCPEWRAKVDTTRDKTANTGQQSNFRSVIARCTMERRRSGKPNVSSASHRRPLGAQSSRSADKCSTSEAAVVVTGRFDCRGRNADVESVSKRFSGGA